MAKKAVAKKEPRITVPKDRRTISKASPQFTKSLGHEPKYYGAQYLERFTNPEKLAQRINMAVRALQGHEFDCVAFTGMSGMLIGPPVALQMGKTFLMVRKDYDTSHSSMYVEGDYAARRYVILDDFSETGNTIRRIKDSIQDCSPDAKCIGMLAVAHINDARLERYEKSNEPYRLET
jgi:adenine/guanine phosphoribosyltransferase-like PRPP-binding protein